LTERPKGKSPPRILCAGIAVQDIVMRVAHFPEPGTKVPADKFLITGGGCAANASVAIARLGGQVWFAGPLGGEDDEASQRIVANLENEGIDCGGVARVAGAIASVSLILLDAEGEKTIATRRGEGLENAKAVDPARLAEPVDAVLVDNRFPEFVVPLCAAARKRGIPVVIDFDHATGLDDPLLKLGTHVISSAEAIRGSTGLVDLRQALRALGEHLTGFIAVTDGPHGVFWRDGAHIRHLPAFPVKAVDSLGAGDTFHGGFTFALVEGRDLCAAMRFGAAAAAIKCTRFGGLTGAPSRHEVDKFLARAGSELLASETSG
jgi:sugar/nucleoside kinase (ribokinase family)